MTKKIARAAILCAALALFPSCLVFKCYNGKAEYKDKERDIIIASDTVIGVGNKAVEVIKVTPFNK